MSQELQTILQRSGALTRHEIDANVREAAARNMSLWDLLVVERQLSEDTLADALSTSLNLPRVDLAAIEIEPAAIKGVAGWLVRKHICLPIRVTAKHLVLAMSNPLDQQAVQDVQFASSRKVERVVACRTAILQCIEKHYATGAYTSAPRPPAADDRVFSVVNTERAELDLDETDLLQSAEISPAVHLCSLIIRDAIQLHASDIHIEPGPQEMRVRLRIDGVLRDHLQLPRWMHAALISRIKILAKLDIAQQRLPQDGRIKVKSTQRDLDVRVATLPTHFGEKVVLRLLGSAAIPTFSALGLSAGEIALLDEALSQPQGLILVTGPTGAGKTTTLYSMLTRRQSNEVNIVTIEDPIEYQVAGASQVQVDAKGGLTFASCLRAILRQDPDVILVGEIRDLETAQIAFQAALTGHLVLSTMHTNGSLAALDRLLDLGLRPLLITSATNLIVAQRLARRICMNCREPYTPSVEALRRLRIDADRQEFQHGRGCSLCGHTGYSGRVGIFEILVLTPSLTAMINRQAGSAEMRRAALAGGTRFLLADALDKVSQGLTTVEEVIRVIRLEPADDAGAGQAPTALDPPAPDDGDPRRLG